MSPSVQTISLDAAAGEIHQACEGLQPAQLPYFFLVGAGISKPPVKLAWEIIDDCRGVAKRLGKEAEPTVGTAPVDAYSHWFNQAYPHRIQRQKYLKDLIKDKNISQANFRLAHLLLEKKITNLVVTTNFDDFLLRALTLFGKQPIVCDHPRTTGRIDPRETEDIQIVHVHGTYWFYDCINLKHEITGRAQSSQQTTSTMASLLDNILSRRVPLVLGYGGWEGDVVMGALYRRLNEGGPLTNRLYWFCYRRSEVETLPAWLREHEDVVFVVPPPAKESPAAASEKSKPSGRARELEGASANVGEKPASEAKDEEPSLDARQVLDRLIRAFDLKSPALTSDPLQFFADHLRRSLPDVDTAPAGEDIYLIKSVVERIERAKQNEEAEEARESQLEKVRDALRRSQYREALREGLEINYHVLNARQQYDLLKAIKSAATSIEEADEEVLSAYRFALEVGELLLESGGEDVALSELFAEMLVSKAYAAARLNFFEEELSLYDEVVKKFSEADVPALRHWVAIAIFSKGYRLGESNRHGEAVAAYDEVVRRFGEADDPALRVRVAMALVNKGINLGASGYDEEAVAAYDEVVRRFGEAGDPALRVRVAKALVNKGARLGELGRREEEMAAYDEVIGKFGEADDLALRGQVAMALVNKGVSLGESNRHGEAVAAYDEVVRRFGEADDPPLRGQVAMALFNKGVSLGRLGSHDEALTAYDEVIGKFGAAGDPVLREQVAKALVNKGARLGELGRNEEEMAAYDEVARRFGEAGDLALRGQVAMALFNKGYRLGELGRREEEVAAYDEVIGKFGAAGDPALREQVAMALVNKGVSLGRLSRYEEAVAVYDEVVRQFGEAGDPALREQVAMALVNKGGSLGDLGRGEEEIAAYEEVVGKFGAADDPALRGHVAMALHNKGASLGRLGHVEEAVAAYVEVVRRFGEADDPALRGQVARALNGLGFGLLCEAKRVWREGGEERARLTLSEAEKNIVSALDYEPLNPYIIGNRGYIAFLSGDRERARELLTEAIALGGERLREGELADADIHTLPQDEEFRALVRSIPGPENSEAK